MTTSTITTRILEGFDDPTFSEKQWTELLHRGDTDTVNLTWQWQRSWWKTFGRGKLLLIVAEQEEQVIALAPLFTESGMVFNLCPEDSLDFIGNINDPVVLDAILEAARTHTANFSGFRFYFIPDNSCTGQRLMESAARLSLTCYDEGNLPSPALDIAGQPETALAATRKKSLRRHENYFIRGGTLDIQHMQNAETILPNLDEFFEQHKARRGATENPSLFQDPQQCDYYRRLTQDISPTGWLRFTRIDWNGQPIAFHYGLSYQGRYLYGIPSFAIELSRHSPGEVLLRQLLLAAIAEGATTFDFGIGDESYKYRFATHANRLHTWGLYPS